MAPRLPREHFVSFRSHRNIKILGLNSREHSGVTFRESGAGGGERWLANHDVEGGTERSSLSRLYLFRISYTVNPLMLVKAISVLYCHRALNSLRNIY